MDTRQQTWSPIRYLYQFLGHEQLAQELPARGVVPLGVDDRALAQLLERLPADSTVLVVSDHGAKSMEGGFAINEWLRREGRIDIDEMRRTFNCGIGMTVIVDEADADRAIEVLSAEGERPWRVGHIAEGDGPVDFT